MKIKAAIYVRVSTEMQEEDDSLSRQIERCRQYCSFKELDIYKVYQDVESGAVDNRISLKEMKQDMKLGLFNVLVVTELSRLSRKLKTLLEFLEELEKYNTDFVSITQNIDTTSAIGRVMFKLIGIFAEFEREQTSERVRHTMYSMAKQGQWTGGNTPYGYKYINGKLLINQEEALNIKEAYKMLVSGKTKSEISKTLSIPRTTLMRILESPLYTGKIQYGKSKSNIITGKQDKNNAEDVILSNGEHDAIVDENTYNIVQDLLAKNKRKKVKTIDNPNYLLGGLVECYCGHTKYGTFSGANYYICGNKKKEYRCPSKNIRASDLESAVINKLNSLNIENIPVSNSSYNQGSDIIIKLKTDKLEKLKEKRVKLMDFLLEDLITKQEFKNKESDLLTQINKLESELEIERDKLNIQKNKIVNKEYFQTILKEFENIVDKKTQKELLSILINKIKFINDFEFEIYWNI